MLNRNELSTLRAMVRLHGIMAMTEAVTQAGHEIEGLSQIDYKRLAQEVTDQYIKLEAKVMGLKAQADMIDRLALSTFQGTVVDSRNWNILQQTIKDLLK